MPALVVMLHFTLPAFIYEVIHSCHEKFYTPHGEMLCNEIGGDGKEDCLMFCPTSHAWFNNLPPKGGPIQNYAPSDGRTDSIVKEVQLPSVCVDKRLCTSLCRLVAWLCWPCLDQNICVIGHRVDTEEHFTLHKVDWTWCNMCSLMQCLYISYLKNCHLNFSKIKKFNLVR